MSRKICVVTGSRAEYGLLSLVLKKIKDDPDCDLQLIVTGMHLSSEYASTFHEILDDGFTIDARVECLLSGDSASAVTKSVGLGCIGFADAYQNLQPDLVLLLGDRFEILAAAQAALLAKIPIAHVHGGELTEAAFDDSIRHAITKMSHLHFVSAEPYRKRVLQLGEQPHTVFNYGAPGLERLRDFKALGREELERDLGLKFHSKNFLITLHPSTLEAKGPEELFSAFFESLEGFEETSFFFSGVNADPSNRALHRRILSFVQKNPERAVYVSSLGSLRYLSLMTYCDVVLGNSSSGIYEAPLLGIPTVNIGLRQGGRLRGASVIDCDYSKNAITHAIQKALDPAFVKIAKKMPSPYDQEGSSQKIVNTLKTFPLENIVQKKFYDLT